MKLDILLKQYSLWTSFEDKSKISQFLNVKDDIYDIISYIEKLPGWKKIKIKFLSEKTFYSELFNFLRNNILYLEGDFNLELIPFPEENMFVNPNIIYIDWVHMKRLIEKYNMKINTLDARYQAEIFFSFFDRDSLELKLKNYVHKNEIDFYLGLMNHLFGNKKISYGEYLIRREWVIPPQILGLLKKDELKEKIISEYPVIEIFETPFCIPENIFYSNLYELLILNSGLKDNFKIPENMIFYLEKPFKDRFNLELKIDDLILNNIVERVDCWNEDKLLKNIFFFQ